MMSETQKPFACSIKGCDMTFTNEDHLNWHQKKHDMMLNLGLASKNNEVADQTPTPTRFIRNCEEVGLFQDLQNVNPFDEFFKKAVEAAKSGNTLEVPQSQTNSDDTLHTPHILPHTTQKIIITSTNDNSHSNDFLNNVITLANTEEVSEIAEAPIFIVSDTEEKVAEVVEYNEIQVPNIKLKIKEVLKTKDKQKHPPVASLSLVPVRALMEQKQVTTVTLDNTTKSNAIRYRKENKDNWNNFSSISLEKIREINRAAQLRCRKRKKEALKNMEDELLTLREEVKRLRTENVWLKAQLLGYADNKNNEVAKEGSEIDNLPTAVRKLLSKSKKGPKILDMPTASPVSSAPKVAIPRNKVASKPLIQVIQVLPAVTFPMTSPVADLSKNNLRKIVPKIAIDK